MSSPFMINDESKDNILEYLNTCKTDLDKIIRAYQIALRQLITTSGFRNLTECLYQPRSTDPTPDNITTIDKIHMVYYIMTTVLIPPAIMYRIMIADCAKLFEYAFHPRIVYDHIIEKSCGVDFDLSLDSSGLFPDLSKYTLPTLPPPTILNTPIEPIRICDRIDRVTCIQSLANDGQYNRAVAMRAWVEKTILFS